MGVTKIVPFKTTMITSGGPQTILATAPGDDCIGAVCWYGWPTTWANAPSTTSAHGGIGFGAFAQTAQKSMFTVWIDNRASNGLARNRSSTSDFIIMNKTGNTQVECAAVASFSNGGTDKGISLAYGTYPSGTYVISGLLFFGTGTSCWAGEVAIPNGTSPDYSDFDPGFELDALMMMQCGLYINDVHSYSGNATLGFCQNVTGLPQWSGSSNLQGGINPQAVSGISSNNRILKVTGNAGLAKDVEVTSFTYGASSRNVRIANHTGGTSSVEAIGFGWQWDDAARRAMVDGSPTPASGNYVESGLAAKPGLVMLINKGITVANENTRVTTLGGDQGGISIGLFDENGFESVLGFNGEDNEPDNTNDRSVASDTRMLAMRNGADSSTLLDSGADPTISMDSGGWTITSPTTLTALSGASLNFEAAAAAAAELPSLVMPPYLPG